MPRNRRRQNYPSTGSMVLGFLSVMLFVGISITVVVLRAQRRAEWREAQFGRNDDRGGGGGFHAPSPQPLNPFPQNPPANDPLPPNPFPQNPPANPQPGPSVTPIPPPKGLTPGVRETTPAGGFFAKTDYREYRPDGAILIGFHLGLGRVNNTDVITALQPIWLTAKGEELGRAYGRTNNPVITVKARDGYAIGGVVIAGGGALEGICFTFMRRGAKQLLVDDFYVSEWYGEQSRKPDAEAMKSGDGGFVVGFFGKRFEDKGGRNFDDCGSICTLGLTLWVQE